MSAAHGEAKIDTALVRRLIAAQFPQWSELPVTTVAAGGWDNRTFHLGAGMIARLPSARRYAVQVEKEQLWLPRLAPLLPRPIPEPLAVGEPGEGYPWRWSVYRWLPGEPAASASIGDPVRFATDLARFLSALHDIDAADGPAAGPHSFWRGGPLATYDAQTRAAIAALGPAVDSQAVTAVWDAALAAPWRGPPVWVHGDVAAGNLLVQGGALGAVIDFGCCAVGDPACDLAIAWTFLSGEAREAFRAALPLDAGTWARGRGWALWKALIVLAAATGANPGGWAEAPRIIDDVLADHAAAVTPRR
jgi:aminoglycoside phosphotransferase (APT) family kinase protein